MKFSKVLCGLFSAALVTASISVPVFAANTVDIKALAATDYDGNTLESISAGDVILVPVDVESADGRISAASFEIDYDTSILTLGVSPKASTSVTNFYKNNKNNLYLDGSTLLGGREIIDSYDDILEEYTYATDQFAVVAIDDDTVRVTWSGASTTGYATTDAAEFYLCFTVNEGADLSGLNSAYLKKLYVIASAGSDINNSVSEYDGTVTKANACDGAFQIVVNKNDLPDNYFIQGITVNGVALDAVVTDADETTYKFPVRLVATNSADATGTKTFTIKASVSETEDGTATEVTWGTVNVAVDGTATSYTEATGLNYATK
jgi:hypothetical protein